MYQSERLLIFLSLGLFVVDSLSGMLIFFTGIDAKISLIYKLFFIIFCLVYIAKVNANVFYVFILLIISVLCWALLKNINASFKYAFLDFAELYKLFSTFVVYFCFSRFQTINPSSYYSLLSWVIFFVLAINIASSLAGFGELSYGDYGAIGFFQGGNAISGVIIIASSYMLSNVIRRSNLYFFVILLMWLLVAILIGTKSSILAVCISAIIISVLHKPLRAYILILPTMAALLIQFILNISEFEETAFFQRLVYFYDTGGIERVIFSGRDVFLSNVIPSFLNESYAKLLFGYGLEGMMKFDKITIEMDVFDILFRFGIIILCVYILFLWITIKDSRCFSGQGSTVSRRQLTDFVRVTLLLLLITSLFSGHILFNGMVTCLWGSILAAVKMSDNYRLYGQETY